MTTAPFMSSVLSGLLSPLTDLNSSGKFLEKSEMVCGGDCCKPIRPGSMVRRSTNKKHPWACMDPECNIDEEEAVAVVLLNGTVLEFQDIPEPFIS